MPYPQHKLFPAFDAACRRFPLNVASSEAPGCFLFVGAESWGSEHGRLLVLAAADALDKVGNKAARSQIAAAKVYAPNAVLRILDAAIQARNPSFLASLSLPDP